MLTVFPLLVQSIGKYVFLIMAIFDFLSAVHMRSVKIKMTKHEMDQIVIKRRSSIISLIVDNRVVDVGCENAEIC